MEKFTDLYEDLENDVDVFDNDDCNKDIWLNKLETRNTEDIFKFRRNINLMWRKIVKVLKNKTKNFDSLLKSKKLKDINLIKEYTLNDIFHKAIKWENIFEKNMFFRKSFFKKITFIFLWIFLFFLVDWIFIQFFVRSWYNNIILIVNTSNNFDEIEKLSSNAKNDFIISDFLFKPFLLIPNKNVKDIYYIMKWWKSLSFLIYDFTIYYVKITSKIGVKSLENFYLTDLLKDSKDDFLIFSQWFYDTLNYYNKVWNIFNSDFQNKFDYAKKQLLFWYNLITTINRNFDIFLNILWDANEKKYLILFQNNDEIRPTWGFIWSSWIISVFKWQVKNFEKYDVYADEWQINKVYDQKIKSPEWIIKITPNLWLRDANFEIDFLDSSKQIKFFTDKINKNIDWIIYINQNIVLDLLKEIWDVNFAKIWEVIWENNFSQILSTLVEAKTFKVWTLGSPKQILFDFIDVFIKTLKEKKLYSSYAKILYKHISSRDMVITSFNPEENSLLWKLWLNWTINYSKTLDYSYPVFTSIWWWKTDRYMERQYTKNVNINPDCSIDTTLNISQTHLFTQSIEDNLIKLMNKYNVTDNNILFIQWKANNNQFVQVVLPKDAIIKKKDFFTVKDYKNSKIVQFYTETRRLESINHTIEYTLKNSECKPYDFKFYKQPWIRYYDLTINSADKEQKNIWLESDFYFLK